MQLHVQFRHRRRRRADRRWSRRLCHLPFRGEQCHRRRERSTRAQHQRRGRGADGSHHLLEQQRAEHQSDRTTGNLSAASSAGALSQRCRSKPASAQRQCGRRFSIRLRSRHFGLIRSHVSTERAVVHGALSCRLHVPRCDGRAAAVRHRRVLPKRQRRRCFVSKRNIEQRNGSHFGGRLLAVSCWVRLHPGLGHTARMYPRHIRPRGAGPVRSLPRGQVSGRLWSVRLLRVRCRHQMPNREHFSNPSVVCARHLLQRFDRRLSSVSGGQLVLRRSAHAAAAAMQQGHFRQRHAQQRVPRVPEGHAPEFDGCDGVLPLPCRLHV